VVSEPAMRVLASRHPKRTVRDAYPEMATNGIDAGVKIRPTEQELGDMKKWPTPDFTEGYESWHVHVVSEPAMRVLASRHPKRTVRDAYPEMIE
jgi:xanthine/CO dehydrogenase XdhC/CoxF family maturation factor